MDTLNIQSKEMLSFISMLISKKLKKNAPSADIMLDKVKVTMNENGTIHFEAGVSGNVSFGDLKKMLNA